MLETVKLHPLQAIFYFHLCICFVYVMLIKLNISKLPGHFVLIIMMVPIFGLISALCIDQLYLWRKTGKKDIPLEGLGLGLGESIFNQFMIKENEIAASVVPLEEALLINDVHTRRSIMLDILHKDPNQYIDLLKMARFNHDTEITHYATTTIMEAQREYDLELQRSMAAYKSTPEDEGILDKYIEVLKNYIKSGLLEGAMLKRQRLRLDELLNLKVRLNPKDKKTWFDILENDIHREQFTEAKEAAEYLQTHWQNDENVWLETLHLCVESNDQQQYLEMIEKIMTINVKWTAKGRERFIFFMDGNQMIEAAAAKELFKRR